LEFGQTKASVSEEYFKVCVKFIPLLEENRKNNFTKLK
jgi:arginyl-tRNA--protein-N-Asp/Glu arginylyltransferase